MPKRLKSKLPVLRMEVMFLQAIYRVIAKYTFFHNININKVQTSCEKEYNGIEICYVGDLKSKSTNNFVISTRLYLTVRNQFKGGLIYGTENKGIGEMVRRGAANI